MNVKYTKTENRRRKELLAQLRACQDAAVKAHLESELTALRDKVLQRTAKRSMERERKRATATKPKPTAKDIAALSDEKLLNSFNCQRDFHQNMRFDNDELFTDLKIEVWERRLPLAWRIKETDSFADEKGASMRSPAGCAFMGIVTEAELADDLLWIKRIRENA